MTLTYQTAQTMALAIAKGNEIKGYSFIQKFGVNKSVGTSIVPVSTGGIYRTPQSTSAVALRIRAGGDAADEATGAGARLIRVSGLDDVFQNANVDIVTKGALVSDPTTTLFTRNHRSRLPPSSSGTYATVLQGSHVGEIIIEDTAGNEWSRIPIDGFPHSTTEIAAYSVAANEVAYILRYVNFTDTARESEVFLFVREDIGQTAAPYSPMVDITDLVLEGGEAVGDFNHAPFKVTGPADIIGMALVDVGTATVAMGIDILVQRLKSEAGKSAKESPPGV